MNLLKDLWGHLKEWNEWKMKDWIKAGIIVVIVLVVLKIVIVPGVQWVTEENRGLPDKAEEMQRTHGVKPLRILQRS